MNDNPLSALRGERIKEMIKSASIEINGQLLHAETGRIAKQASGSAVITLGETAVLVTAVSTDEVREGVDFLPLTVEYQEMSYAGGRFPGNYFRRDMGRPSEMETLTARLIDRPLRPLFPDNYFYETQVIATVLSTDKENDADMLAMLGASLALELSDIPFQGPIAGVRVGRIDGKFIANPTRSQQVESDINLIVAGSRSAVVMVEGGARFMPESLMIDAIFYGHEMLQPLLELQQEIRRDAGKGKREFLPVSENRDLEERVANLVTPRLNEVITTADKKEREKKRKAVYLAAKDSWAEEYDENRVAIDHIIHDLERKMVRRMILEEGKRIDGRSFKEVRPIDSMVGILPRVHGSALFTRGETQAIVLTTLGTEFDEQRMDTIYGEVFRHFIFHYNFPPYSVGEAKRLGGPSRRDIGHGALARRALHPVIPSRDEFQYSIRTVSEIMESNGSSSMASVCGGSLSLMDAGVPIKAPVAGVAMGLISEGEKMAVLTDILGDEDHYGDMDFKVAGTEEGVTAIQMDIKVEGLTRDVMAQALEQAREARLHILEQMNQTIGKARPEISKYAPIIKILRIKQDKIRSLIGPGGKVIKEIISRSGSRIDVDDDGKVVVSSPDEESSRVALDMIDEIVQEAEIGKLYKGKVRKIMDFGAFVEILPGTDGLIHISQLDKTRVNKVTDILNEGDEVLVKVLDVDDNGRISLSRKAALDEAGDNV